MLMCLVRLLEDRLPFFADMMALMLSWWMTLREILWPRASKNNFGIKPLPLSR
jgi:hypothetical protein